MFLLEILTARIPFSFTFSAIDFAKLLSPAFTHQDEKGAAYFGNGLTFFVLFILFLSKRLPNPGCVF